MNARSKEPSPNAKRHIAYEVVELTSRVSTNKVADAKRRLTVTFCDTNKKTVKDRVDVALATNMISVGLDITRLGLMVVFSQPKTSAEYIQATSRVGRHLEKPGLVVTLLNVHRPRDRSHYERFGAYHQSFYRTVEATSVTPFSPPALERGLAGTLVALVRHGHPSMTPPRGAGEIGQYLSQLDYVWESLARRASGHNQDVDPALGEHVRRLAKRLIDDWAMIAHDYQQHHGNLQYQPAPSANASMSAALAMGFCSIPVLQMRKGHSADWCKRDAKSRDICVLH